MPHIHTNPGQHDFTVSAYIIRREAGEWKCLVHMHKKLHILLQVGGHVELAETPWQALEHELQEEAGYGLDQLDILQPSKPIVSSAGSIIHPIPVALQSHVIPVSHFHTDLGFAFIARELPKGRPQKAEATDLRWCSVTELQLLHARGEVPTDVFECYQMILEELVPNYVVIPVVKFSLQHPA